MLKKVVTYTDFNGDEQTDTLYFNVSVPEATRMRAKFGGDDMEKNIKKIVESGKESDILELFEEIVLNAYGEKSEDGKSFLKTPAIKEKFEYSQAYAEVFEELLTNEAALQKFVEGVISKKPGVNPVLSKFQPTNN